jgi:phenylalanyl-tRNA synthetase beta chain
MKFTLSWLKDHLETEADLETIAAKLSMIGLEVEGIEDKAAALAPFTVAYVKEAKPHPDADRLRVCIVETSQGEVQVVCGAPNARTGMKGVFAPAGTHIPGTGIDLKKGVIRGQESNGMLVSEREMGLSDDHEGIIELEESAEIGTPFAEIMGLNDPVIEIAITPNRGDCLGVRGIARDLATAGLGKLKPLDAPKTEGSFESPIKWVRALPADAQEACPYVGGRYFKGVKNGPSPAWMQRRLKAIGLRPISALVDITNYVTFDLGRPLHVFDAGKLKGDLTMRFAKPGESIEALDERTYTLDGDAVVIADETAGSLQGIGGIMGGEESGVTPETTEVFLECALFDPVRVATTGRRFGILSDARYRFERGLDPQSADWGVEVATRLIHELCGGEASQRVSAGEIPDTRKKIALRPDRVKTLGGIDLSKEEQKRILTDLGFEVGEEGGKITALSPSWRPDIELEPCLVEEILRIHGYDEIPIVPLARETDLPLPALTLTGRRIGMARTALAFRGMNETVTFSFLSSKLAKAFQAVPAKLMLDNPISADLDAMRPTLLANLLEAAARNSDRGYGDLALFEVGADYQDDQPEGQREIVAGLRAGAGVPRHWSEKARALDLFDAKGDLMAALEAVGAPVENLQVSADAPAWYHPGRSGQFRLGPNVLGAFGELHPKVLKAVDLRGPVVGLELYLEAVPVPKSKGTLRPALEASAFQPLIRDFAFVVEADLPADKLLRAAKSADKLLITAVRLFDLYQGQGVPEGKKSLAIEVTLQPREKTLTDSEIEAVAKKIVAQVEKATGGVLRG